MFVPAYIITAPDLSMSNGDRVVSIVARLKSGCSRSHGYFCSTEGESEWRYTSSLSWHA